MYITAFMTARMSVRRLPPPGFGGGMNGLTRAHSSSVKSLGYLSLTLANLGGARESQFCRVKEYGGEFCHCLGLAVTVKKLTRPYFSHQTIANPLKFWPKSSLDTQDFTKGILSPVQPQIIKQLFDQGVDPRVLMLLFFTEYQDRTGRRFLN